MSRTHTSRERRTARHLGVALTLLGVGGMLLLSTLAVFTDQENVGSNTFTTGSVDLSVSQASALVTFTSPAMVPGDQVTAPLTVSNIGSLALRYALTSTTTEDVLASALVLTVKSGVTTCTNAGFGATGTQLYTGVLGSTGGTAVLGNPAQGAQAGDRTLAVSGSEVLCFNVTLPSAATNTAQGITTTATFAFAAEQTTNNP